MNQVSVTVSFPVGATPQEMAARLRMQANVLLGKSTKEAAAETEEDIDVIAPSKMKTPAKKKTKPVVEEDEENFDTDASSEEVEEQEEATEEDESESENDDDDDEEVEIPKKVKKVTIKDVNDACKTLAANKKVGRNGVLKILKAKFKTESIQEIDSKLWPQVIKAMNVSV